MKKSYSVGNLQSLVGEFNGHVELNDFQRISWHARTPTQVASHAQKYFDRQASNDKKNRWTDLFDMPLTESSFSQIVEQIVFNSLNLLKAPQATTTPSQANVSSPVLPTQGGT